MPFILKHLMSAGVEEVQIKDRPSWNKKEEEYVSVTTESWHFPACMNKKYVYKTKLEAINVALDREIPKKIKNLEKQIKKLYDLNKKLMDEKKEILKNSGLR